MGAFGVEGIKTVSVNGASIAYRHSSPATPTG